MRSVLIHEVFKNMRQLAQWCLMFQEDDCKYMKPSNTLVWLLMDDIFKQNLLTAPYTVELTLLKPCRYVRDGGSSR